jgi:hypothetical protein
MVEHFVTYNQALALKELGFNEPCLGGWDKPGDWWWHPDSDITIDGPLKSQVFKWFWVYFHLSHNIFDWLDDFEITITEWSLCEDRIVYEYPRFDTYEQAESACIDKLIEIIKEKKL